MHGMMDESAGMPHCIWCDLFVVRQLNAVSSAGFAATDNLCGHKQRGLSQLFHELVHGLPHLGRGLDDCDARCFECLDLVLRRTLTASDDGTRMSHSTPRRRCKPCMESIKNHSSCTKGCPQRCAAGKPASGAAHVQ